MFNTITEVIEDLKQGKMIIVVDDASRENEGLKTSSLILFFSIMTMLFSLYFLTGKEKN